MKKVLRNCVSKQERYDIFTERLAELSLEYGVIIRSVGGVEVFEEGELKEITYDNDLSSGDLIPTFKDVTCENMEDDAFIATLVCPRCGKTHSREQWNEAWRRKHRWPRNKIVDVFSKGRGPVCPSCRNETTIDMILRVTRGEFLPHNCLESARWIDIDSKKCGICGFEWYDYSRCQDR